MKTKNEYRMPVKEGEFKRIDRTSPPDHAGNLKNAIDFICDDSTPIYAANKGVVVSVKDDSQIGWPDKKYWNDGNRIVIKHENDEFSAYEHLRFKGSVVSVGQKVKAMELIGYSGNTGYTFGPHLHFEVVRFTGPNKEVDFETLEVEFTANQ